MIPEDLGDWIANTNKFPEGLNPLVTKISGLGLDFGLWVEPGMVNPDSALHRKHPDRVFYFPNGARLESRNQLVLNQARKDVYDYLHKSLYD